MWGGESKGEDSGGDVTHIHTRAHALPETDTQSLTHKHTLSLAPDFPCPIFTRHRTPLLPQSLSTRPALISLLGSKPACAYPTTKQHKPLVCFFIHKENNMRLNP